MGLMRLLSARAGRNRGVFLFLTLALALFIFLPVSHCSKNDTTSVQDLRFTLALTTYVDSLPADNSSQAKIWATVKQGTGIAPDSTYVVFQSSVGTITSPIYTRDGLAEATLTAGVKTGVALVAAQAKGVRDSLTIRIVSPDSLKQHLSLELFSIPDTISADSSSQAVIWCTVRRGGQLVEDGTTVFFESTSGNIEPEATTKDGLARSVITSGVDPGSVTVYAQVTSVRDSIAVYFSRPGEFSDRISLGLLAVPDTVRVPSTADSTAKSAILATVTRAARPVANNTKVFFRSTVGTVDSVKVTTDGLAIAILRIPGTITKTRTTVFVEVLANIDSIRVYLVP